MSLDVNNLRVFLTDHCKIIRWPLDIMEPWASLIHINPSPLQMSKNFIYIVMIPKGVQMTWVTFMTFLINNPGVKHKLSLIKSKYFQFFITELDHSYKHFCVMHEKKNHPKIFFLTRLRIRQTLVMFFQWLWVRFRPYPYAITSHYVKY